MITPTEGAVTNLVKDLRNRLKRSGVTEGMIQTVYGFRLSTQKRCIRGRRDALGA